MKKKLPHLANRKTYVYEARSAHYRFSVHVTANSIKEARVLGRREALRVFGNHSQIHSDSVSEQ